ncbi:MAG: cadherin domain-containing protein [Planctomycetaceae bacterium]
MFWLWMSTAWEVANWTITGGNTDGIFAINSATGELTIVSTTNLNFETTPLYSLKLKVGDGASTSVEQTISIFLQNENDRPVFSPASPMAVNENAFNGTIVGYVAAIDPDVADVLTYSLVSGSPVQPFTIDSATGAIRVASSALLDFETVSSLLLTVQVQDAGGLTDFQTISIAVNDLNEAPISLQLSGGVVGENSANGTVVGQVTGTDLDAGDSLTYRLLDSAGGRFATDASTGIITVADGTRLNFEAVSVHSIVVETADAGGLTYQSTMTLQVADVNEAPVAIGDSFVTDQLQVLTVPSGVLLANDSDVDGDALLVVLAGGPANGTLTLSSDGAFSFKPAGTFTGKDSFTYYVTDGQLNSGAVTVTIQVQITVSGQSPTDGDQNQQSTSATPSIDTTGVTTSLLTDLLDDTPDDSGSETTSSESVPPTSQAAPQPGASRSADDTDDTEFVTQIIVVVADDGIQHRLSSGAQISIFLDIVPENELRRDTGHQGRISSSSDTAAPGLESGFLFQPVTTSQPVYSLGHLKLTEQTFLREQPTEQVFGIDAETMIVGSSAAVSTSVSVGYVVWLLRGGTLLTSFLSALPAWQSFDPLPVLNSFQEQEESDDESLASLASSGKS